MKHPASDADIPRWRDRPEGGASDEDRAAALARAALASRAFPEGLDDRQLLDLEGRLEATARARPPRWLRPAVVAALLTVSAASVMGYETGWFAPLRGRLRFRSIPAAGPGPAPPAKRREGRTPAARAAEVPPPPVASTDVLADEGARPVTKIATAAPVRKAAVVHGPPVSPPPVEPPPAPPSEPTAASQEIQALEQAVGLLRGRHDAPAALAALDDYLARFPTGVLAPEARVTRIDALLMLDRGDEALRALDSLPLDGHRRSTELQLIRGELRARTDCGRAEADFTSVLARVRTTPFEERALYGRAACRSARGDTSGAADDLRRYVSRFPSGAHAEWARRYLGNIH